MGGGDASVAANNDGSDSNNGMNAAAGSSGGCGVSVNIRFSNGSKLSVLVSLDATVRSFKSLLAQQCDIPAEQQRVIYKGRILKDDHTLESYGLEANHSVYLVRGFAPPASTNTSGASNPRAPSANQNVARDAGPNLGGTFEGPGLGASLFHGLNLNRPGSGRGLFGAGLPDFEQLQLQMNQNPNMMRDILNTSLFQNLMNNPEIISNSILNNPQLRDIMDRNPEFAHVLNDPSVLRQTMQAARNPELMRELMRNTDRAMSNIESSPEGFNMLRRMYENVQEPLLNATTMAGGMRSDRGSNSFAALFGGQGRDHTNNPSTTGSETTITSPAPNTIPLPNPWAPVGIGGMQTNTTARDASLAQPGRLGGVGLPGLHGRMPDSNTLNQLMRNPAFTHMMRPVHSNHQHNNQMVGRSLQSRSMLDSNPQLREIIQNPETMQQLLRLQQSHTSQHGQRQTNQGSGSLEMVMNMFGRLGSGGFGDPSTPNGPPEEVYESQLTQLQEMGFFDTQENVRALVATAGNVRAAVELLLGNPGQ